MKTIKFNEDYNNKSNLNIFTTIRDEPKGKFGDIVLCKFPDKEFKAKVISIHEVNLSFDRDDSEYTLFKIDTGLESIQDVCDLFEEFYGDQSSFYCHLLKKC